MMAGSANAAPVISATSEAPAASFRSILVMKVSLFANRGNGRTPLTQPRALGANTSVETRPLQEGKRRFLSNWSKTAPV